MKDSIEEAASQVINELSALLADSRHHRQPGPQLGLLGTVFGMIKMFTEIMLAGSNGNTSILAGGIAEALICTAGGLMVAIPAIAAHRFSCAGWITWRCF